MTPKNPPLSIADIAHGEIVNKLNNALVEAAANIRDPNTDATAKRKIVLTLTLDPAKDRSSFATDIKCETKLAAPASTEAIVFISQKINGEIVLSVRDERQEPLFNGETREQRDQRDRQQAAQERREEGGAPAHI